MSANEISVRCGERIRFLQDRLALRFPTSRQCVDFGSVTQRCAALLPGADTEELGTLGTDFPKLHASIKDVTCSAADEIMGGTIELLGQRVPVQTPDWHKDPLSDFRWPEVFFGDVQIYELPADVKYVWEVSRHQFLPVLGQAWALSNEDRYAERVQQTLLSWIDANPLYRGVNWTSALEVAIRAMSWVWSIGSLATWRWDPKGSERISGSLADHATFLHHHLSYYSSPYNHLVGEAAALYLLSFVLEQHADSLKWRRRATHILETRGPGQFYEDGFTVEQATGYHFFTVGFLLQAILAGRHWGQPLTELERSVEKASVAGVLLCRPDGTWPCIGDLDSARSVPVPVTDLWDFGGVCALASSTFENEPVGAAFADCVTESYWLLGSTALKWLTGLEPDSKSVRGMLPDAGYACWTSSEGDWALLDCGPVGDGVHADSTASVAHGHDDALSLHAAIRGKNILHDSGMFRYAGSRDWVDYLRGEHAHNRITVDDAAGMENAGRLAWRCVTQETDISAKFFDDAAFLRGELRYSNGIRMERNVMIRSDLGIWVADVIDLDQPRGVTWRWHLPADVSPVSISPSVTRCDSFSLRNWSSQSFESTIITPREGAPEAWHAPGYGVKSESRLLAIKSPADATRILMLTQFGAEDVDVDIAIGAQDYDLSDADSMKLPQAPLGEYELTWQVRNPSEESYCIRPASRESGGRTHPNRQLDVMRQP